MTGYLPFNGSSVEELLASIAKTRPDPPRNVRPEISAELQKICLKGLAKKKEDRYPDATSFAAVLRSCRWT